MREKQNVKFAKRLKRRLQFLVRLRSELKRDPVQESFALRHKRIEACVLFTQFQNARLRGDIENMENLQALHDVAVSEWQEMAVSYEKRFL